MSALKIGDCALYVFFLFEKISFDAMLSHTKHTEEMVVVTLSCFYVLYLARALTNFVE